MNFASDNTSGVAPEIMAAIERANRAPAMPYGDDPFTAALPGRFAEAFERPLTVYPVATGTAANGLSMSVACPPFGAVYCFDGSHLYNDECGAPEFFTGGAKLIPLPGENGKLSAETLDRALNGRGPARGVHVVQPAVVSLTQATEVGTLYTPDEIAAIAAVAHGHGMKLHMDGARFANAVAASNASPADLSWRAGVDLLSFGATKNGAMAAEAVLLFDPALEETLGFRRKRSAHLFSKMRYLSAQLDAALADGLWLRLAGQANAMARRLADGLQRIEGATLLFSVEANMIFATLPAATLDRLQDAGFLFYRWGAEDFPSVRLVLSFDSAIDDVDRFIAVARGEE